MILKATLTHALQILGLQGEHWGRSTHSRERELFDLTSALYAASLYPSGGLNSELWRAACEALLSIIIRQKGKDWITHSCTPGCLLMQFSALPELTWEEVESIFQEAIERIPSGPQVTIST